MPGILVATCSSEDAADHLRVALHGAGVRERRIRRRSPCAARMTEPLPEDHGIAGFTGRMFSGFAGSLADIRKYEDAARRGASDAQQPHPR